MEVPPYVLSVMDILHACGYDAYLAGGCVRDLLLARIPKDWDITTSALPAQILSLFDKTLDIGREHGTIVVLKPEGSVDITTFRVEGRYRDHRHPDEIRFTGCLEEDLSRRDFTINAMAMDRNGEIIDLFDGQKDIRNGILRCVGDPLARFSEDALRMMRCLRFAAQLGFTVEGSTCRAISSCSHLIRYVSRERIRDELSKILLSQEPGILYLVYKTRLLSHFLPALHHTLRRNRNFLRDVICLDMKSLPYFLPLRLALLLSGSEPDMAEKMLKDLHFEHKIIQKVMIFLHHSSPPPVPDAYSVRKIMVKTGRDLFPYLLDFWSVAGKSDETHLSALRHWYDEAVLNCECISLSELEVGGDDLLRLGWKKGREIGMILNDLLEQVILDPRLNQKDILLGLIRARQSV